MHTPVFALVMLALPAFVVSGAPPSTHTPGQAPHLHAALAALDDASRDLQFTFTPGVWLARAGGDITLGPAEGATELSIEDDFDLDDNDGAFNFEFALIKSGKWQVSASGFDFSTDSDGVFPRDAIFGDLTIAAGDSFEASLDITSMAMGVSYWQWHPIKSHERNGTTDLRFAWGLDVRWLRIEDRLELTGTGLAAKGDGDWLVPSGVFDMHVRYELEPGFPVLDAFEVLGAGSVGPAFGSDGGIVFTLRAGLRAWVNEHFSLDFGYRLIHAVVESDDHEVNGGLQGLFLSGTIRF